MPLRKLAAENPLSGKEGSNFLGRLSPQKRPFYNRGARLGGLGRTHETLPSCGVAVVTWGGWWSRYLWYSDWSPDFRLANTCIATTPKVSSTISTGFCRNTSCKPPTSELVSVVPDSLSKRQFAAVRFRNLREYKVYSRNRLHIALSNTGVALAAVCRLDFRSDFSTAPATPDSNRWTFPLRRPSRTIFRSPIEF